MSSVWEIEILAGTLLGVIVMEIYSSLTCRDKFQDIYKVVLSKDEDFH